MAAGERPSSGARIYLAGPEVFFPEPHEVARGKKEVCASHGLVGLFPTDAERPGGDSVPVSQAIYEGNVALIDGCDGVIANMMPFRGVSMDVGTAFEIGYAVALGKPVFGWSPTHDKEYRERFEAAGGGDGMEIEDFGNTDNLMVVVPLAGGRVHPTFESAAEAAGRHFAGA